MRIELCEVGAAHGGRRVLQGVTLSVASAERLALLGPSGSGKSTLLAVLAGLHPAEGRVVLDGRDATRLAPRARGFGMVFQELALWPHLTVAGHLHFVLDAARVARGEQGARVDEVLALVELSALARRLPAQLSGGEAQRLALARALVARPRALLLDEPLGALDRRLRERMLGLLADVHARTHATTVLVTHDYDEALAFAERVAVLDAGRLLQCGTPEEVYRRPLSARVAELGGPVSLVRARRAGDELVLPWGRVPAEFVGTDLDEFTAVLRPEALEVVARDGGPGRVRSARFRAGRWWAEVECAGTVVVGWSRGVLDAGVPVTLCHAESVWATRA